MASEIHDWSRPSVQAYVNAVLALTPADWERLTAAFRMRSIEKLLERARAAGHPDPAHALRPQTTLRPWQRAAFKVIERGLTRVHDATLAPAWQRQGVGPARLLYERFQHPYVTLEARSVIEFGLNLLWLRSQRPVIERPELREIARVLSTVVPWDAIWTTPDADGSVGRLSPEPRDEPASE